jgi:hypothetical protein
VGGISTTSACLPTSNHAATLSDAPHMRGLGYLARHHSIELG